VAAYFLCGVWPSVFGKGLLCTGQGREVAQFRRSAERISVNKLAHLV
jgi:hypothetical protein